MPSLEEYIAAGLYDPDDVGQRGRVELLDWLSAEGFTIDEMQLGIATRSLGAMAGDRRLLEGERLTHNAAVEWSGLDAERFDRMATAVGLRPYDPTPGLVPGEDWTAAEASSLATLGSFASIFSAEEALGFLRVVGSSLSRIADAAVSLFLNDIESQMVVDGTSELELALKGREAVGLLDGLSEQLDPLLRRLVMQAIQRSRRATIDPTERFNYRYAVGFVDLVGFTEISGRFDARTLATFIRDFEGRAHDVVMAEGAQVVKLIGDEIMFVATEPDAACRAANALMEGFGSADDRVVPRGGLAIGDVLARGGDFYGAVVNLASRLVDEAVPQEVLVTEDLAEAATSSTFEPAGRRMIKGFAEPVVVRSLVLDD